jgi:drug/metabolite transporter (DMT)-like permease
MFVKRSAANCLQQVTSVESSIINNTMLIQIAVLAWIFLGERLTWLEIVGLILAAGGILLANLKRQRKS